MSEKMPTPVESNCQYAIRRPSGLQRKASRTLQFLFIHPVRRAVDGRLGSVSSERDDRPVVQAFDVDVVRTNVGDTRPVRRELREHQRRLGRVAADLLQRATRGVEDPVVAARVDAPHLFRVREDEELSAVVRPRIFVDVEGRRCVHARTRRTGRHQARSRDEDRARAGGGVVAGDLGSAALHRGAFSRTVYAVPSGSQMAGPNWGGS